jgi:tetratricopeptide (TPR) repeat protein
MLVKQPAQASASNGRVASQSGRILTSRRGFSFAVPKSDEVSDGATSSWACRFTGALLLAALALLVRMPVVAQADDSNTCGARRGTDAVAACTRVIESGRAKGDVLYLHHNNRGGAYQSIGTSSDHYRAIDDFTAAIRLDAKLPFAFINRGVSWAMVGAYDRAIDDFANALRIDPRNARAYNNRGGAYRDRGEFDRAMADFNKAIALDPKLADALFNRGTLYMQKEDYNRAIADYTVVIRQSPKDVLALAVRGRAWSGKEDLGRAKADFEAALAVSVEDERSKAVQDAVRELLQALLEKQAAIEDEVRRNKQAEIEKAAREKQAALDRQGEQQKQAVLEKQAAAERKEAAQKQAAREKKAITEKKAAEKQAALQKPSPIDVKPELVAPPQRTDRIALVIGNAAYHSSLGELANPGNDARDVADALKRLGFNVWLRLDLEHVEMKEVLSSFARAAQDVETAVVFFAGHGFQYGGTNYLAPVDAPITDDSSIANHVSLDWMMASLRAERGFRILIIDACRNNLAVEQAASRQAPDSRFILVKRGLSPVTITSTWSGGGMLVAFSTLPGDVAADGAGRNSPFAHALVKHLLTPGLELRHLFVRVRADVVLATSNAQIPQVSDALNGEYEFRRRPPR